MGGAALGLNQAALGSEVLGLWVEQLVSAPDALPPEVSGVGAPPEFHVWAPSSLICVRNRASGERRGCLSRLRSPGEEGGGAPGAWAAAESSLTSP